ncbi:hypothetical protein DL95DRAFT_407910 [Leptodontidium sp. 2 PMI_412]|nr:hypothetical protein DL95DRAFT_407910 [Leptodontidium sp. 2 PMI_412]
MAFNTDSSNRITFSTTFVPLPGGDFPVQNIDQSGYLGIRIYDTSSTHGHFRRCDGSLLPGNILGAFVVSAKTLCFNSAQINRVYTDNGWEGDTRVFADIEFGSRKSAEILLSALRSIYNEDLYSATIAEAQGTFEFAQILGINQTKLKYWFFMWLTKQSVHHLEEDVLQGCLELCNYINHPVGAACLEKLIKNDETIHVSILGFPPILAKSFRQHFATIFFQRIVEPHECESLGYSPAFQHEFGEGPVEYYSDFKRPMTTPFRKNHAPKIKCWAAVCRLQFLSFAKGVDDKQKRFYSHIGPVWRDEMEAGWVQMVIDIYCNDVVSSTQISNPAEREEFHFQLYRNLRKVGTLYALVKNILLSLMQRFHLARKVHEYWTKKMAMQGGRMADIKRKKNGCDEKPEYMRWPKAITQPEMELDVDFDGLGELMSSLQVDNEEREVTDENAMVLAFRGMKNKT